MPAPLLIRVREKNQCICRDCRNRYDSYYFFCPQCLGVVQSVSGVRSSLILHSVPAEKHKIYEHLFTMLAGRQVPEAVKAMRSLPWTVMIDTDRVVLERWKEALEVDGAKVEIHSSSSKGRRHSPIFASEAPPPYFWNPELISDLRKVSSLLVNPAVRIALAEVVLEAHDVAQNLHRHHPDRILFADLPIRIEQLLQEIVRKFFSYYRTRERNFPKALGKTMDSIHRIKTEIQEVQDRVNEQL